jgi:hypothetical protein
MEVPMRSLRPSVFALLAFSLLLTGCQKLFTTSLASGLARDSYTISADISNEDAAALLADSELSPAALTSLLSVLNDQAAAGNAGSAALAAEAAVGASGVSTTLTQSLTSFVNTGTPPEVSSILSVLKTGASTEVVEGLSHLGNADVLKAADMSSTELVVAATLLAASALDRHGITDPTTADATALDAYKDDDSVIIAKALIEKAAGDSGANSDMLASLANLLNTGASLP